MVAAVGRSGTIHRLRSVSDAVSVLSDATIRRLVDEGRIGIEPWDPAMVQPASVDLRLGSSFRVFHNHHITSIDLREPPPRLTEEVEIGDSGTFVIHPGEFCLGATREWVELPDDIVARIEGKALALDTEVPTPLGWSTMGELRPGDRVFDRHGRPVRVVAATEPMHDRTCREVVVSEGASVVADLEHRWEVRTSYERRRLLTTRELENRLRLPDGEHAFRVEESAPVRYPERELPLDPYVLGTQVGEAPRVADRERLVESALVGSPRVAEHERGHLQAMGLPRSEHIPREFLEAGVEQRFRLLRGLMDAGGTRDARGRCVIATIHRRLAEQYAELLASLGFRPTLTARSGTARGGIRGPRHEVGFTSRPAVAGRAVVDVRPVPSVPVRCIEVDSPGGSFLVTRSFITTHNSSLGRLGLIVHATAGFCDPGWKGALTLELNNLMRVPIVLSPGLPIAQLSFMTLDRPAERPYGHRALGSRYQGQAGATQSRYGENRSP